MCAWFDVCREVIHGTEPVIRYHYSVSGNYTLRLKVGRDVTESAPLLNDVYSRDVKVLGLWLNLVSTSECFSISRWVAFVANQVKFCIFKNTSSDAIKNIELKGPSDYEMSQGSSLAVHVDGRSVATILSVRGDADEGRWRMSVISALPCGCAGVFCPSVFPTPRGAARWPCCTRTPCGWTTPSPPPASTAWTSASRTTSANCRLPSASASNGTVSGCGTFQTLSSVIKCCHGDIML